MPKDLLREGNKDADVSIIKISLLRWVVFVAKCDKKPVWALLLCKPTP
jgi:hypothetical protein